MLWAIVSSFFVIYLYRSLNATASAKSAQGVVPTDGFDVELAELNRRIDAIETITNGKARGTTP